MTSSAIQAYIRIIYLRIPWEHWVVMVLVSLALTAFLLITKKTSFSGAICLGITVFVCVFLLDSAVVNRLLESSPQFVGFEFTFRRLLLNTGLGQAELLANIAAFVPFGLFLSEFLASAERLSARFRLGLATLAGFSLSLCIECLQLLLRVGFFELTDLVMNTLGAFVGAGVAFLFRRFLHFARKDKECVTRNNN